MANEQTRKLISDLVEAYNQAAAAGLQLQDAELEKKVPIFRGEQSKRAILYGLGNHAREHSIHIQKVLQETGAAGARGTEALDIIREANAAMAAFLSAFSRVTDNDLDKEFESQSPRKIIEHVKHAVVDYGNALKL